MFFLLKKKKKNLNEKYEELKRLTSLNEDLPRFADRLKILLLRKCPDD